MKKIILSLSLMIMGFPSLFAMEDSVQCIEVSPETFEFVVLCKNYFSSAATSARIMIMAGYNDSVKKDLSKIDPDLDRLDFISDFDGAAKRLQYELCDQRIEIQDGKDGNRVLELGPSFLNSSIKIRPIKKEVSDSAQESSLSGSTVLNSPFKKEVSDSAQESSLSGSTVLNSPFLKSACAATLTGAVTYSAIWFYNKEKTKEQQYSPIKWSLGVALVVGAGTYLWLQ